MSRSQDISDLEIGVRRHCILEVFSYLYGDVVGLRMRVCWNISHFYIAKAHFGL